MFSNIPPFGLVLLGVILLMFVVRVLMRSARNKSRSAVLRSMGFAEVPREQVFESPQAIGRLIEDRAGASILSPVGKGSSGLGETILFDFAASPGAAQAQSRFTVVGFRVSPSLPDFEILHVHLLDRFFSPATAGTAEASPDGGEGRPRRVLIDGSPDFTRKYAVWTANETRLRPMVTRGLMDALTTLDDSNLHVIKASDWLFIFRYGARPASPDRFPALVEESVRLVQLMDLHALSPIA